MLRSFHPVVKYDDCAVFDHCEDCVIWTRIREDFKKPHPRAGPPKVPAKHRRHSLQGRPISR
jgi:hypothetical protein